MLLLSILLGCVKVESHLNKRYSEVFHHYKTDTITTRDKLLMQATYRGGALVYMPIAPYASRILRRCINGNSRTLHLHSRYIRAKSPKIQQSLKELKHKPDGTYRYGGFRQREDMKLSYAFNPYNITLDTIGDKRTVTVWYDFTWPEPKDAYPTYINVGPMSLKLNDSLVHVISDCPTYRVEQRWMLSD
mgnify:FL=1